MISAATVAALVGYAASVAIVLAAATVLGATSAQAASWRLAVSLGKAFGSALLSWWSKVLVVLAWSTRGAALIAATGGIRPLGAMVARIPDGIAAGTLAGVSLPEGCVCGARVAHGRPADGSGLSGGAAGQSGAGG